MQEQSDPKSGQSSYGDYHQKFETSTYRPFVGIASFDRPKGKCRESRKSVGPPSHLWQREQHRDRWNQSTNDKGDPNLRTLPPGVNAPVIKVRRNPWRQG